MKGTKIPGVIYQVRQNQNQVAHGAEDTHLRGSMSTPRNEGPTDLEPIMQGGACTRRELWGTATEPAGGVVASEMRRDGPIPAQPLQRGVCLCGAGYVAV